MEEKEEKKQDLLYKICESAEESLSFIYDEGINADNVEFLYKVVDIMKDIKNIDYWKQKEEYMMYREYNGYSEGSYGRRGYNEGGSYGRRGVPGSGRGRYRGEEMLDEMKYHYGAYQESYNAGNYGAKEDSSYKMTEAFKEFVYAICEELEPKDKQQFKQAMQEMAQKMN